jgi:predicted HicB family RNase H-like nuclease
MTRKAIPKRVGKVADMRLRVSAEDKKRFEEAAHRRGLSLSSWLRMLAIDAIEAKKE